MIKKEKHRHHDLDDPYYFGIRDVEKLFGKVDGKYYYKPILVKSSFKDNYKYYESRGEKSKNLFVEQYLDAIKPYLRDLINNHKVNKNKSKVWKIQISIRVNFISSKKIQEKCALFMYGVITKTLCGVLKQITLL